MQNNTLKTAILAALIGMNTPAALHAELNTALPGEQEESFALPLNIDLPAQPLAAALRQFAIQSNLSLTVDSALIVDKKSPAVKGRMTRKEAIKRLLDGTGLQGKIEGEKMLIQRALRDEKSVQLDKVEVRAKRFYEVGPLPGLGLTKEEIPGNVQSISAKEIKEAHSLSLTDLMNRKLQSVTVNDYQGNPFQMDVQYRGFTAGPQIGTPQGLSVFFDGIRVNEPFGDVVNWDMIPLNALAGVDVFPGSNPIFGLNTLGGAFSMKTKDGFNNAGLDADILTGSFDRKQLQVEGGWNNGTIALFSAGNFFLEDGWRKDSPSKVNQFFGKASYRGEKLDLNLSTLLVKTELVGNGLVPSEVYAQDRKNVFTSPDTTDNNLSQFQLSGSYFVSDNFTITGQVYSRNSKRHQIGADAFMDWPETRTVKRLPQNGEEFTCLFKSTNQYGMPDYVLIPVNITQGEDFFSGEFTQDYFNNNGVVDLDVKYASNVNAALPDYFVKAYTTFFNSTRNIYTAQMLARDFEYESPPTGPTTDYSFGEVSYSVNPGIFSDYHQLNTPTFQGENVYWYAGIDTYYYEKQANGDIIKNYVVMKPALNIDKCQPASSLENTGKDFPGPYNIKDPGQDFPTLVDGAYFGQSGYVDGIPTAVITDNNINQTIDGASLQFNWNLEKHKFMIGMSIDSAQATYTNSQRFGMLTPDRHAYLAPDEINPVFAAATIPLQNNNFSGTNLTKSIYFSETWNPVKNWNFNLSARYNETQSQNNIATRYGFFSYGLGNLINFPFGHDVCRTDEECANTPLNYRSPITVSNLDPSETEKFSYYSLNPSMGLTWQANENVNVFANISQGARTPSVIELGCAFDETPTVKASYDDNNDGIPDRFDYGAKSVVENRSCSLPNTLSGDPYLKQIRSTSYDFGARGKLSENIQWNLNAYQTDLRNDIYFIAVSNGLGFFDNVGNTRRRGIEGGISGKIDKWNFGFNYSLTDATFQDNFTMISEDNSSAVFDNYYGNNVIKVKKGNRMPGVPLHNLNANVSYDLTDQWTIGFNTVIHSKSFVRGNENNEHRANVPQYRNVAVLENGVIRDVLVPRQAGNNPGYVSGFGTVNFFTSYKISKEWTATLLINNLFDKEYFSAGRLGRNPFSPSIQGAIGPDGYNHNSNDWLSTNFIAPGAPRGVWFSLNWHFVPD
ncbi:TonB-dependent receptor domain-containing protein [Methylophilus sp. TWE2]|uniref:TonB-dependent receptor domain-containing protein n=1 Tax=Methylophilus sp. TWE2 TaxID=1662285 RepID=UPI0006715AFD|nr:TonB-dependent receptor [Methylophilus sp. TWE2]AKR42675.1 TonB-dependent receptor [Methylophilus sp. TWE2]